MLAWRLVTDRISDLILSTFGYFDCISSIVLFRKRWYSACISSLRSNLCLKKKSLYDMLFLALMESGGVSEYQSFGVHLVESSWWLLVTKLWIEQSSTQEHSMRIHPLLKKLNAGSCSAEALLFVLHRDSFSIHIHIVSYYYHEQLHQIPENCRSSSMYIIVISDSKSLQFALDNIEINLL